MAEVPPFERPVVASGTRAAGPLTLADRSGLRAISVRADPDADVAGRLGAVFGSSRTLDDVLVCGQRPGAWVLLGTYAATDALVDRLDRSGHVSVVDVTHGQALFELTGNDAPAVLEKVCSLDWSDEMTPDGAVASASVARVACDVVRHDRGGTRSYLVACDRSFGQYLFDAVLDAGQEFGITVAPPPKSS